MLQWPLMKVLPLSLFLIGCTTMCPNEAPPPPLEETAFIRSGSLDTLYMYPFRFHEDVSIRFYPSEHYGLGFCLNVRTDERCETLGIDPTPIYIIEFVPHCQNETVALSIKSFGDPEEPFTIFYVDGQITLEREEAEEWVLTDPSCSISFEDDDLSNAVISD